MVLPGFRIHHGLRFVLLCALLALAIGGRQNVHARSTIDPFTDRFLPVGHLGGAATIIRLLPDDYAALALGNDLLILDLLDPFHPVQIGKLSFSSLVVDLHVVGNFAYVLAEGRIHILGLADLSHPVELGMLDISDVRDIDLDDQYMYIASQDFYIYSISTPTIPVWISTYQVSPSGQYESTPTGLRVVAAYPYLYLQAQSITCPLWCWLSEETKIVDISNPTNPMEVSGPGVNYTAVQALAKTQDYNFVLTEFGSGVLVVAYADMATLMPSAIIPYMGNDLAIQGSTLYVADKEGGIRTFDITNPLSPLELGWESSILDPRSVAVKDHLAFVAGGSQGLGVINIRNPAVPILSGGFRTVGAADHITIAGNYLYASSDRLDIVDISNPTHPKAVGTYNRRGSPVVADDVLFLAAGVEGLAAVNISNPAAPAELDQLNLPGEANAVAVNGDFAYVANSNGELQKVNVSDPSALSLVYSVSAQSATDIVVSEGYAALAGESEVSFYDIAQPTPEQVFSYSILVDDGTDCSGSGTAKAIAGEGDRVYVIWDFYNEVGKVCILERAGMLVFKRDAQDTWQLSTLTGLDPNFLELDIEVSDGIGYILSGDRADQYSLSDQSRLLNIWVFDAATPPFTNSILPYQFTGWVPTGSDWTVDLALQDNLVVMGKYEEGVHLLQWLPVQKRFLPAVHNGP